MSKWECTSGHVLDGLFYNDSPTGEPASMPGSVNCPFCGSEMVLTSAEGAAWLLHRIRRFVGRVAENPEYKEDSSQTLTDLARLENTIKKLSDEALRP